MEWLFNEVETLHFGSDAIGGPHLAYTVRQGERFVVVADGVESSLFTDSMGRPAFSPDSARFGF
jgi:hypothetical protein